MRASKHVLALMLALVWPALGGAAETMRAISFIPKNDPVLDMENAWVVVVYDKFMRELGMVPVTINAPEVYTALNSGVVDGFGWPVTGPRKRGWLESVKYVIDLPFFAPSNVVALMNLDKFNALPEAVRNQLT